MVQYIYSKSSDFPSGDINPTNWRSELEQSFLSGKYENTLVSGDSIILNFSTALDAAERTVLDGDTTGPAGGLIGAHQSTQETQPVSANFSDYHSAVLNGSATTASNSPVDVLVLTTPVIPSGQYRITYGSESTCSRKNVLMTSCLLVDDVVKNIKTTYFGPFSNQRDNFSGVITDIQLSEGIHTISLKVNRETRRGSLTIENGTIEIFKVN